jgi:hypothetical protein
MLALATDHSTGYLVGQLVAIVLLATGAIGLGLRALDRRGRRDAAAAATLLPLAPPPTTTALPATSVAPPGFVEPARAFAAPPARPRLRAGRDRRARVTDAIAAFVCAVLLVAALVRFADDRLSDGPWDTPQARELHAGFVAGCRQTNGGVIDCDCVFEHLTSVPPFDTPAGFANLGRTIERTMPIAIRSRDVNALPAPVVDALRACLA